MKPARSDLEAWDRHHVWHAFTQMQEYEPLLIESGEGVWLIDIDGNRYIDGSASMWCNVHGHRHARLDAALADQAARVAHTTNLGLSNPTTVEFARRLAEITPAGLDRIFFSDDGSTAIEAALKMSFQYWRQTEPSLPGKKRFIAIEEAYHGDTLGAVGVGGVDRFTAMFEPLTFTPIRLRPPGLADASGHLLSCDESLAALEAILTTHGHEVAALVMEPIVQMAGGVIVHPRGYLRGVRELTSKHHVLLILDEVATGFGRTGTMFACEQEAVVPDFLCIAKGLTAGYLPMAATITSTTIHNAFLGTHVDGRAFYHGHTYGGNPLAAAVGLASLDVFRDDHVLEHLSKKIARLAAHAETLAALEGVGEIRQCGFVLGIDLVADKATKRKHPWQEQRARMACHAARKHGVLLRSLGDTVVIIPPLSITEPEIDLLVEAAAAGISEEIASADSY